MYRVSFFNQGKVYEVYARKVTQSGLYGFVELEELIFDQKTQVVVDPAEERLKDEFAGVKRTYIPIHTVVRIDEVDKRGTAKITPAGEGGSKVMPFPVYTSSDPKS